jgi:hypothetical protein
MLSISNDMHYILIIENTYHMIPEGELVPDHYAVPLLLRIISPEDVEDLDLDLPLLVQLLLVLQDLHGHVLMLRVRVVYASEDHSEGSTA